MTSRNAVLGQPDDGANYRSVDYAGGKRYWPSLGCLYKMIERRTLDYRTGAFYQRMRRPLEAKPQLRQPSGVIVSPYPHHADPLGPNHLFRQARERLRSPAGLVTSRRELADLVNAYLAEHAPAEPWVDRSYIGKIERGVIRWPHAPRRTACRSILGARTDADLGFMPGTQDRTTQLEATPPNAPMSYRFAPKTAADMPLASVTADAHHVEELRRAVTEAVSASSLSEASVEDWERRADEHGWATRTRTSGAMLADLIGDFAELSIQLDRRHPASTLRRLTRVTAQMAGLMFLTLIKLDERAQARAWVRTAYLAAEEAGDIRLLSWVRAQEAYVHYYSGDLRQAIAVAEHAQRLAGRTPSVGLALAAALQARATAASADARGAHTAIATAETTLARLTPDEVIPSAFGYSEAQLRFHTGNAFTHLNDVTAAWTAQQRALELYPPGDYLDRALVHLDRMACLINTGSVDEALDYGTVELADLAPDQRVGLVNLRAIQILDALPTNVLRSGPAQEFRQVFALPAGRTAD